MRHRSIALACGLVVAPACTRSEPAPAEQVAASQPAAASQPSQPAAAIEPSQPAAPIEPAAAIEPIRPPTAPEPAAREPEPAAPSGAFLAPAKVLARASASLRHIGQDRCELPAAFPSFMTAPARRVHFENDWGRVSATVPCEPDAEVNRIDIYPRAEPSRRYVVHFIEAGLAVEERHEGRWQRRCDGARCGEVAEAQSKPWIDGYSLEALSAPVFALARSLAIPTTYEALSSAPILAPERARGFIVFARAGELFAVRPDGSAPVRLGVPAPSGSSSRSFGPASDGPLVSPDGQTLAHLDGGALQLTTLAGPQTRAIAGLPADVLIGPWSPDSRALLVYAGEPRSEPHVVDTATSTVQRITGATGRLGWGASHRELLDLRREGDARPLVAGLPPDLAVSEAIASLPIDPGWMLKDVRAGRLAGLSPTGIWAQPRAGERVEIVAIDRFFVGGVRLSPDGRHLALVTKPVDHAETDSLTAFPLAGGAPIPLLPCSQTCEFYWYDADHVVMLGRDSIHLASLARAQMVVADDARGISADRSP